MRPNSAHSGLRGPPLTLCDIMQRGYLPQVHLLVNLGANLETRDRTGRTPLMLTAYVQPEEWGVGVARLLIEQGVRMSHRDKHGMNALHHACVYERVELVRVLLNAPDFDLVQSDKFGNTALHYAAMSGNVKLVSLVTSYHRRYRLPINKINNKGRTARDEAFLCGSHDCADILDDTIPSSSSPQGKDDVQSECESNAPVFVFKEDGASVATCEDVKTLRNNAESKMSTYDDVKALRNNAESKMSVHDDVKTLRNNAGSKMSVYDDVKTLRNNAGSKMSVYDDAKTANSEDVKHPLRRGDEEGGLFAVYDQTSQDEMNRNLLSPFHSPPASERSTDSKTKSSESSPRTRRSGIRRAHPATERRMSTGSTNSSRSGASARKQSLLSVRSNSYSNSLNANTENSNTEVPTSSENEVVKVTDIRPQSKVGGHQEMRRNSALSENTNFILNNAETVPANTTSSSLHGKRSPRVTTTSYNPRKDYLPTSTRSLSVPLPYEKDPERVIHVASESDFRNTREYVLKLTRMAMCPTVPDPEGLPALVPPPAAPQDAEDATNKPDNMGSWRNNIRFLYRHLEYQCSPSFREAAKPPPEPVFNPLLAPAPQVEEAEDTKEKKSRRPSSSTRPQSQMNDVSTSGNTKRKPSAKQRKISAVSPPSGPHRAGQGGEPNTDSVAVSSSESVSTGTSSKKKADHGTTSSSATTTSRHKSQTSPTGDN